MQSTQTSLTIIVPVYNEQKFVKDSISRLYTTEMPLVHTKEVIVIDDCSRDDTYSILQDLNKTYPFKLHRMSRNQGKGAVLRYGITLATGDLTVFHDADLEYNPEDFNKMLPLLISDKADAVYGSRFSGGELRKVVPFHHALANRFLTLLTSTVCNQYFTDMETCYKMFVSSKLKSLVLHSDGFTIEPELTIRAAQKGFRFFEVAISYEGRNYLDGKKIDWLDGIKAVGSILYYSLTHV